MIAAKYYASFRTVHCINMMRSTIIIVAVWIEMYEEATAIPLERILIFRFYADAFSTNS